jgi:hypothetical protein
MSKTTFAAFRSLCFLLLVLVEYGMRCNWCPIVTELMITHIIETLQERSQSTLISGHIFREDKRSITFNLELTAIDHMLKIVLNLRKLVQAMASTIHCRIIHIISISINRVLFKVWLLVTCQSDCVIEIILELDIVTMFLTIVLQLDIDIRSVAKVSNIILFFSNLQSFVVPFVL